MPGCRVSFRRSAPTYGKRYRSALEALRDDALYEFMYFLLFLLISAFYLSLCAGFYPGLHIGMGGGAV